MRLKPRKQEQEYTVKEIIRGVLQNVEQTRNAERRTQNAERGTQNAERRTQNAESGTQNAERRTQNAEH